MKYKFKFKRIGSFFWTTLTVVGHRYEKEIDKMILYFANGTMREIAKWTEYDLLIGKDFIEATRQAQEKAIGQPINLAVEKE